MQVDIPMIMPKIYSYLTAKDPTSRLAISVSKEHIRSERASIKTDLRKKQRQAVGEGRKPLQLGIPGFQFLEACCGMGVWAIKWMHS